LVLLPSQCEKDNFWDHHAVPWVLNQFEVRGDNDHVVASFREHNRPNPTLNVDGLISWLLTRQFQVYKEDDHKAVQEKALLLCVIKLIALKPWQKNKFLLGNWL
jgi:hypothetical protein